jgi:RND family efflux transporter MFP subunit
VFISSKTRSKSITVEKASSEKQVVAKTISASGEVTSKYLYDLAFEGTGRINQLSVAKGDPVTKGMLLASAVNLSEYNDIQALRDTLDIAKRDKDIYVELYDTKRSSVGGENEYEANVRRFDEYISRATANYTSSLNALSRLRITSPIDGTVVDVIKEQNEVAATGQPVVRVADLSSLVFEVLIDQEDFGLLSVGDSVELTLDSYKDKTFSGEVSALPLFAQETGDFEVNIAITDSDKPILLGMKGDATVKIDETSKKVTAIAFDLLNEDDSGYFLWIDDKGILKKKKIEIGLEGDFYTEVKTDISGLTLVIPAQDSQPVEGLKVRYAKSN